MDTKKIGFSRGHALLIGIAAYPNVRPLPDAVIHDIQAIESVLVSQASCGYDPRQVVALKNHEATLAAIGSELKNLADRAQADDTVIIYFSGHGARLGGASDLESVLIPYDYDPASNTPKIMWEDELSSALARISARRLVVFIDACHSGAAASFKNLNESELGFSEKSLDRLAASAGRVLIASSRSTETSLILAGATNSLFTEHLLDALQGGGRTSGDGLIRVFEIFNHISEKVRAAALGKQHPIFKASDLEDNFPVALDRGGTKNASGPPIGGPNEDDWVHLQRIFPDLYPLGPGDEEIWTRAGGDLSQLQLSSGTGRSKWHAALVKLKHGGGGANIDRGSLVNIALEDFPQHPELNCLRVTGKPI